MDRTASLYTRMICTAFFCTFSLVYLYGFQSDILFRLQHAASGGRTHYVPVVGALLITIFLKLLQVGVYAITRLHKRWYAITYFPSCLIIAILTSLEVDASGAVDYGMWTWLSPLLLVVYIILALIARGSQSIEPAVRSVGLFSQLIWINVFQLVAFFMMIVLVGIHDEKAHIEAHGQRVVYSNVRLFASSRPVDKDAEQNATKKKKDTKTENPVENTDSILCNMLMKRQLEPFAMRIRKSYNLDKAIPRVYAEALQLYMSTSKRPRYYWNNKLLSARLSEFLAERNGVGQTKNRNAFLERFGDTYWMYYSVESSKR